MTLDPQGRPLNIAIFASAFYPSLGGVEELCRQLAHELKRRGHSVIVLANRFPRDLPKHEVYEGIDVYRLPFRIPIGRWRPDLNYRLTHALVQWEANAILKRHRSQLVNIHCVSCQAMYALGSARSLRLPLVVTLHGELTMDAAGIFKQEGIGTQLFRQSLETARAITGCSGQTLREAEGFFGKPFGERGRAIHNGIQLSEFQNGESFEHPRPYILAVGRHVPQKGFDVLLEGFSRALHSSPQLDLIIAGDGPERSALEKKAADLGLNGQVRFFGRADRKQIVSLFRGCEFFVLASRLEPFGIVCLEAMACGKAVIASRTGGVPEFIRDRQTGILFTPGSAEELGQRIAELAADKGLAAKLGEAGRASANEFDWKDVADRYVEVYRRVLSGKAG